MVDANGSQQPNPLGGRTRDGKHSYVQYEFFANGVGGRNGKDGPSATSFHLSNRKIAPVEITESEFPTKVDRSEFLPRLRRPRPRAPFPPGRGWLLHAHRQTRPRHPRASTPATPAALALASSTPAPGRPQGALPLRRPAVERRRHAADGGTGWELPSNEARRPIETINQFVRPEG